MRLNELLEGIDVQSKTGNLTVEVTGVQYDSRAVEPGMVFVAIHGAQADGNSFIPQALDRGAVAIISENSPSESPAWIEVASDRGALASLAAGFYNRPTTRMKLVGITGTNGKTTTAYLVESILGSMAVPTAMLGTIDYRFSGYQVKAERTTSEAPDLERLFSLAVEQGCRCAVMEVSSHAIAMRRVDELDFDVVAFTNLSSEHLDFHHGMREYFEAKQRLFTGLSGSPPESAILNRDDPYFEELARSGNSRILSFGVGANADIHPIDCDFGDSGIEMDLETPSGKISLKSTLQGRPNLYNIAAAVGIALAMDCPLDSIAHGVGALDGVPGRFENIDRGQDFRVIVDYAHTDDALAQVLDAVREITTGRVIVVFGAGGDRDRSKRFRMGEVAGKGSDMAVVTSDNPRNEDPLEIIAMITDGLKCAQGEYESVPDRRQAIARAIEAAAPGDTVVVAGKGHETVQVIGDRALRFDDRDVARDLLDEFNARRNR